MKTIFCLGEIEKSVAIYTTKCTHFAHCLCTRRRVHRISLFVVHDDVYIGNGRSVYTTTCTHFAQCLCTGRRVHRISLSNVHDDLQ